MEFPHDDMAPVAPAVQDTEIAAEVLPGKDTVQTVGTDEAGGDATDITAYDTPLTRSGVRPAINGILRGEMPGGSWRSVEAIAAERQRHLLARYLARRIWEPRFGPIEQATAWLEEHPRLRRVASAVLSVTPFKAAYVFGNPGTHDDRNNR